ncbi:small acid-soluble spore protein Tlp [Desulfosporosinus sp.]|uniref:small acid-soluble spore protein Tlp n=1 Tax=Desulfosporosinus sp. TaxID=157907 RepID=UPI0025B7CD3E|nr:small acid-soluble spore protein Tlp [Desulfosporosinus sp.]MBC2727098.1 small acid-soluble spore protein Tlp [Desulfosporosinus sp.]
MAKPDDRSDNEERLQDHIDHTFVNLRESERYLEEHSDEISNEERQAIEAKNERRRESIDYFIAEKKDEARR